MRIRMLRGALGSPDGINVYGYEAGSNYLASEPHQETGELAASPLPLSNRLAALFIAEGWAVDTDAAAAQSAQESVAVASEPVAAAPVEEAAPVSAEPAPTVSESETVATPAAEEPASDPKA